MSFYQFKRSQFFKQSPEELWSFISNPHNLKEITPDHMGFIITSEDTSSEMYEGMIISYKVSPLLKIKTTWVTEITHIKNNSYFVDEQRISPYKLWHHEHILEPMDGGTMMIDIISYQPPFGFLGRIANRLIIQKKLNQIFEYRTTALERFFG